MAPWRCAAVLIMLALPPMLHAQQLRPLSSYEEGSVPALSTKPRPPAPTGPLRVYVCGNEHRLSWVLESPEDHFTQTRKCLPPFVLVLVPDEHLEEQRQVATGMALRSLKLVGGRIVRKTQEEQATIDREWHTFVAEKTRARAARRHAP